MRSPTASLRPTGRAVTPFARVLCAVDGSRAAQVAVRQAASLAQPGAAITVLAVSDRRGSGRFTQATLSPAHAAQAAASAKALLAGEDLSVTVVACAASEPTREILHRAADQDLLALGIASQSRLGGIFLGHTVAHAVHASPVPVLVARHGTADRFPGCVVAASGGEGDAPVVEVAARIAAAWGTSLRLVHAGPRDEATRRALARQRTVAQSLLENHVGLESLAGRAADQLPAYAGALDAALIVLGSHRGTGAGALASVSERVAFHSPCSVLIMKGR
jgi:nucleotide-binding universal stress UspA family protein